MGQPENAVLYVTRGSTRRKLQLPGLTVEVIPGAGATNMLRAQDAPYKRLFLACEPRWLLENMSVGKLVSTRVLPQGEVEQRLDRILVLRGEHGLNALRETARRVASELGMQPQFERLDRLIGALLGSRPASNLKSKQALARGRRPTLRHRPSPAF